MSFMFNPYPYYDPYAVNTIPVPEHIRKVSAAGIENVVDQIVRLLQAGAGKIGLDMQAGVYAEAFIEQLKMKTAVDFVCAEDLLLPSEQLDEMLTEYLPQDKELDPVLLYGRRFKGGYAGIHDPQKVQTLADKLDRSAIPMIVWGRGALCEALRDHFDVRIWLDITPLNATLNFKNGLVRNLGVNEKRPHSVVMRRNYYVDFELSYENRWALIRENKLDYYIAANDPQKPVMLSFAHVRELFEEVNKRPLRCRPVYLEGVWGGTFFKRLRHLPDEMRNCAWIFDMIPLEVSLVLTDAEKQFELETPFFTYVQAMGQKLLGQRAFEQFGGYFPVRFNYDDTYHASGNMSIQCHPHEAYVVKNHSELGRQDESYYICVTGQDAKTYLGFVDQNACDEFMKEANRVQESGELMDYTRYVNAVPSYPGMQVMIPAGTIHASGRNQIVLEIGSLTIGSYTYKLYDYQRTDRATGQRRPIHLKMGAQVIRSERDAAFVKDNLVDHGYPVRSGEDWLEMVVGEHDLLYFSLRNLKFEKEMQDDTASAFQVLSLVDGEHVRIESINHPDRFFDLHFMDIVVLPAELGAYRLINLGEGQVTIHKTCLKEEEK